MLTLTGKANDFVNHFRCISADITANKHIPDAEGYLTSVKLKNGDELYNFETGDTYIYDEENKKWLSQ